jgi:hypothetical protein
MSEAPASNTEKASKTGYGLLVATAIALVLSVALLSISGRAAIVAALVGWKWLAAGTAREGGVGYFLLHVVPQLLVVGPPLSAITAAFCAAHFISRRGRLSRRAKMIWLLALGGATAGWPVACSCLSFQGLAESGQSQTPPQETPSPQEAPNPGHP